MEAVSPVCTGDDGLFVEDSIDPGDTEGRGIPSMAAAFREASGESYGRSESRVVGLLSNSCDAAGSCSSIGALSIIDGTFTGFAIVLSSGDVAALAS